MGMLSSCFHAGLACWESREKGFQWSLLFCNYSVLASFPFSSYDGWVFSFFARIFAIGRCICCLNPIGDGMRRLGERFNEPHLDSLQEGKERERIG